MEGSRRVNKQQRDGGWQPVVQRPGGRGVWNSRGHVSIHSVFVDNLPEAMGTKGLYSIFSNYGVVVDTFIPNKRRKMTRSSFGFVRYNCSVAADMAVQKANGLWCDDKVIKVKLADFGKDYGIKYKSVLPTQNMKFAEETTRTNVGYQGKRSFAEVITDNGSKHEEGDDHVDILDGNEVDKRADTERIDAVTTHDGSDDMAEDDMLRDISVVAESVIQNGMSKESSDACKESSARLLVSSKTRDVDRSGRVDGEIQTSGFIKSFSGAEDIGPGINLVVALQSTYEYNGSNVASAIDHSVLGPKCWGFGLPSTQTKWKDEGQ
ncbi:hypothetical protein ACSBR1_013249 [Camellia fascicularis]